MSFLDRLVAPLDARASSLRPRIRSLYERAPDERIADQATETASHSEEVTEGRTTPRPEPSPAPRQRQVEEYRPAPYGRAPSGIAATDGDSSSSEPLAAAREEVRLAAPDPRATHAPAPAPGLFPGLKSGRRAAAAHSDGDDSTSADRGHALMNAEPGAAGSAEPVGREVHVSIGRVEIRAAFPSAPSQASPPAAAPVGRRSAPRKHLSLEEYFERRTRRER